MILVLALVTVLHNGTVIDGTGAPPRIADVNMSDGRITHVGKCNHPKNADDVDATGKYVMPGLIDMHVHVLLHPGRASTAARSKSRCACCSSTASRPFAIRARRPKPR